MLMPGPINWARNKHWSVRQDSPHKSARSKGNGRGARDNYACAAFLIDAGEPWWIHERRALCLPIAKATSIP